MGKIADLAQGLEADIDGAAAHHDKAAALSVKIYLDEPQ